MDKSFLKYWRFFDKKAIIYYYNVRTEKIKAIFSVHRRNAMKVAGKNMENLYE